METDTVNGNGVNYSIPLVGPPPAIGTYEWAVSYSGDSNNNPVTSPEGSEPEAVITASPTLTTTPGGTILLGRGGQLTDSATLGGGFNPTGTITFATVRAGWYDGGRHSDSRGEWQRHLLDPRRLHSHHSRQL